MDYKTKVVAEAGRQDLHITREFDLPVELLFKAYEDPEILSQWMGTRVLKLENQTHGGYEFETANPEGQVMFRAHGTIHTFQPNRKIVRTFEMENAPFEVQLEFLEFEPISEDRSRLSIHALYRSNELRDQLLKLPFAYGINMAHSKLEQIMSAQKNKR